MDPGGYDKGKAHVNRNDCMNKLIFIVLPGLLMIFRGADSAEVNVAADETRKTIYDPRAKSDMDDLASVEDVAKFAGTLASDWMLFVEDRSHSIRKTTGLPKRWLDNLPGHMQTFSGTAQPGEFYVFQIGLFAAKAATGPIAVRYENLPGTRCFNLGGTNFLGQPFIKPVRVGKGKVQALWFGFDVPKTATGAIQGKIIITAASVSQTINVKLAVAGAVLDDHGDRDSWRLSRLRWLDSTIGLDDNVVTQPFLPIVRNANAMGLLGRKLMLGSDGLPCQIRSFFNADNTGVLKRPTRELLAAPFRFVVETDAGPVNFGPMKSAFTREQKGAVDWIATLQAQGITLEVSGLLEYDGFADCRCRITSATAAKVKDIRLEVEVAPGADTYFMGLGKTGGKCPEFVNWKWNTNVNQDGFWIGAVNGGFKLQLYGANWRTPLINCYYHFRELMLPESWGTGGIRLNKSAAGTKAVAYTGPRDLAAKKPLDFNFRLFLTPFKPLATEQQWALRYQHGSNDEDYRDLARVKAMGANIVNIHQSREANPTINYPYFDQSMPLLKNSVASGHANGVKVKIYYTTREITNNLNELFAFWSLDGEIICSSPGLDGVKAHPLTNGSGPHPWLVEHLGERGFIPAWRDVLGGRYKGLLDLAVITTPDSRLDNFYCEGLAFTLRETGFDGMYIDDTSLGRKGFQRAHRIFEAAGKPLLADMHSWNHWNPMAGSTPSAYCYLQNFPYYHRIWYGEGFSANHNSPDYMLVEMSGIPFGLMSEMLDDPNTWRGMVFGMTTRLGWSGNPRPLWKFWDEFGMQGTALSGWWNPACPVKTGNPDVRATVYEKSGKSLIALASSAPGKAKVKLDVEWNVLRLDPKKTTFWAPAIEAYQREAVFAADGIMPVEPGRGWLLVADQTPREITGGPVAPNPMRGLTVKSEEKTPFEISVPANTVRIKDVPWSAGAIAVAAHIDPMGDEGQSWGVGLAVGWTNDKYVQINARTDGRWGIRHNGHESFGGSYTKGTPASIAIKLDDKSVQLLAKNDNETDWDIIAEFPPSEFPTAPAVVRIGKIGATWNAQDHGDKGLTHPCRVDWVKFY